MMRQTAETTIRTQMAAPLQLVMKKGRVIQAEEAHGPAYRGEDADANEEGKEEGLVAANMKKCRGEAAACGYHKARE